MGISEQEFERQNSRALAFLLVAVGFIIGVVGVIVGQFAADYWWLALIMLLAGIVIFVAGALRGFGRTWISQKNNMLWKLYGMAWFLVFLGTLGAADTVSPVMNAVTLGMFWVGAALSFTSLTLFFSKLPQFKRKAWTAQYVPVEGS